MKAGVQKQLPPFLAAFYSVEAGKLADALKFAVGAEKV
jgi:hypothetical protein